MGRKGILSLLAAALLAAGIALGLASGPASSAQHEQPDASCSGPSNASAVNVVSVNWAQTFTAQSTGSLTAVEVPIQDSGNTGSLTAEILAVDGSGVPTNTALASATLASDQVPDQPGAPRTRIVFDPGAQVVAGERYAVALSPSNAGYAFIWAGSATDPCPGNAYVSIDDGPYANRDETIDLHFAAFVTPPDPDEPRRAKCTIKGTNGSDTLIGTPGDDVICGFGGGDALIGKGGDDILRGGPGKDSLDTTDDVRGNDTADGGRGRDACATDPRDTRKSC